jgi:hypothetical protein
MAAVAGLSRMNTSIRTDSLPTIILIPILDALTLSLHDDDSEQKADDENGEDHESVLDGFAFIHLVSISNFPAVEFWCWIWSVEEGERGEGLKVKVKVKVEWSNCGKEQRRN